MAKYDPTLSPTPAPETGLANPIRLPAVDPSQINADDEEAAYNRGAEAGKRENDTDKNPYPEESSRAKAFDHGYLDAQKIRSSDKPPG
ncbi:Sf3a2-prov protein [Rhizobium sp. ICMP 5592]|uniref:Sf3a2-prov protein n=1 Tax=Rhizobium sp. ICMP 5592 TaxID=2292445 RepID=UPI001297DCF0|nr:Sf3a2-prov protein [Rhizobium sp. ICMP 5592]MQB44882.1 Sf3a2-prov protein [Rhizobium sp. ICMP 5592]